MKRLLIVQYSGDFRAAWRLREDHGSETYYGHGYILDQLALLGKTHGDAGFLCCAAPAYEERLPNGAMTMGAGTRPDLRPARRRSKRWSGSTRRTLSCMGRCAA